MTRLRTGWLAALLLGAIAPAGHAQTRMALTSSAFAPDGAIPAAHTCDAADRSPPLAWSGVPAAVAPRSVKSDMDFPEILAKENPSIWWSFPP